ncbi:unnamed protein product [Peronospora belbahrii]|uniref:Uncharacterized protein n=1 Tax=Peronospora belbahrii TaxID=622444 RepID=A0AAU9KU27_9STRA|nr:unnamed protein product [Peronospora belbahrii]
MKADFVAVSELKREVLGLREMLSKIGIAPAVPMPLQIDNITASSQMAGEASALKAKHVDVHLLSVKDLGRVSKFLGMMVAQNGDGGYNLDQEEVIGDLLRTNGLMDANSVRALIGDDCYDENLDGVAMLGASNKRSGPTIRVFQSLVGSLLRIARCKKPDIALCGA